MGPVKEDKTVVLSLKLKALEDQMEKAVKSSYVDGSMFRDRGAVYREARDVLEVVETLEDAGIEHTDAVMISILINMRRSR